MKRICALCRSANTVRNYFFRAHEPFDFPFYLEAWRKGNEMTLAPDTVTIDLGMYDRPLVRLDLVWWLT